MVGTEYFLNPHLSLIGEAKGRFARISGFNGTYDYVSPDTTATVDVKGVVRLYMNEQGEMDVVSFGEWNKADPLPPPQQTSSYRDARLDFSGVVLRFGLSYHF